MNDAMSLAERADALEHKMMRELDAIIVKSRLFNLADGDTSIPNGPAPLAQTPGKHIKNFGADYRPDPYIEEEYKRARDHKWYMTARLITVHDIYSFDPNVTVELEEFTDIVGRNFKQPKEGLGWDSSPAAHMWRTLI